MTILYYLDIIGVFVFAISGCVIAASKRMDYFGIGLIGMITAIGGGTVRDLILGASPVAWVGNGEYIIIIGLACLTTIFAYKWVAKWSKVIFLFDALGIATCSVLGTQKALDFGCNWVTACLFGVITAVFGGIIRDVICNRIPLILRKEVYATACLAGALLYCFLGYVMGEEYKGFQTLISMLVILVLRVMAVKRKWHVPVMKMNV